MACGVPIRYRRCRRHRNPRDGLDVFDPADAATPPVVATVASTPRPPPSPERVGVPNRGPSARQRGIGTHYAWRCRVPCLENARWPSVGIADPAEMSKLRNLRVACRRHCVITHSPGFGASLANAGLLYSIYDRICPADRGVCHARTRVLLIPGLLELCYRRSRGHSAVVASSSAACVHCACLVYEHGVCNRRPRWLGTVRRSAITSVVTHSSRVAGCPRGSRPRHPLSFVGVWSRRFGCWASWIPAS